MSMNSLGRLELLQNHCASKNSNELKSFERVEYGMLKDCFDSGLLSVNYKGFINLWGYLQKSSMTYYRLPYEDSYVLFSNKIMGCYTGIDKYSPKSIRSFVVSGSYSAVRLMKHIQEGNISEIDYTGGDRIKHWNGREFVFSGDYLSVLTEFVGNAHKFYDVNDSLLILCKSKDAFVVSLPDNKSKGVKNER